MSRIMTRRNKCCTDSHGKDNKDLIPEFGTILEESFELKMSFSSCSPPLLCLAHFK